MNELTEAAKLHMTIDFATDSGGKVWIKATAPSGESASEIAAADDAAIVDAMRRACARVAASVTAAPPQPRGA